MQTETPIYFAEVEYTDTFGGEANYSWCRRRTIALPEKAKQPAIMRKAKAAIGITGCRGRTCELGESLEFRPYGCCAVLFVNPIY